MVVPASKQESAKGKRASFSVTNNQTSPSQERVYAKSLVNLINADAIHSVILENFTHF